MRDDLLEALGERQREQDGADADPEAVPPIEGAALDELVLGALARADAKLEAVDVPKPHVPATRSSLRVALSAVIAVAAAFLLWVGLGLGSPDPLPTYEVVALASGVDTQRSFEATSGRNHTSLRATGPLDWRFAPGTSVEDELAVVLAARGPGDQVRFEHASGAKISAAGAVHLVGTLDEFIALTEGRWELRVIVGRADELPEDAEQAFGEYRA